MGSVNGGAFGRSEELLRESEERFRLLVEEVKDYAIFMLDPEGRIVTWNRGAERIKGYKAGEILGRHFSVFYTEADIRRGHPAAELRIAAAEGSYEEKGLRLRKDGSRFWANVVITALRGAEGDIRGFAKVTRDITERVEAEERERMLLREQVTREQYSRILESISDAFFAVDDGWRFTYVNRRAEELWGRSRDDLLRRDIWEEFPQLVGSELHRQMVLAAERRATAEFETASPILGTWVAGQVYPSEDGLSVYFRDVTAARLAAEELRRSTERYRGFVEQSTEGIWRFELEEPVPTDVPAGEQVERLYRHAYLAECNDAMAAMYGYSWAEELVGARLGDFLPRSVPENIEYLETFVRSGYRVKDAESEEPDREGRPKNFLNNLTGIVEDGRLVRAWGIQRDVTESRHAEKVRRFLAESSDTLASSLDYRTTLARVASLAVPALADWCAVDVLAEDGALERLAVAHADPEKVRLAYELQERYPPNPASPSGVHRALRTGRSEVVPEIPPRLIEEVARDEGHREALEALGLRSYMIVPLLARGRTLGAISLVAAESGRAYGDADLEFAQELARRAALAVDNARLYEEAQKELAERERAEEAMQEIREAERNRLARELHDGVLQDLTYAAAAIEVTKIKAEGTGLEEELGRAMEDVRRAVGDLREAVYDLHAYSHKNQSMADLLGSLVELNRGRAPETTITLSADESFFKALSEREGMELLRVVQEALTNSRRHSGAKNVHVGLKAERGRATAEISDDGSGFDPEAPPGVGLRSMLERTRALGGTLEVDSEPGRGTRVLVTIPVSGPKG